ncbi:hypothetical protein NPIL_550341 [Nephila pilipes]|uniref:Uncharacterized protein n=1 Tax=Nephila pilipes TaxID=299642 RepID=A0A8X6NKB5_NEPPI|nr:hypothetical protein NPIL_550341 [Nephila pilipes]
MSLKTFSFTDELHCYRTTSIQNCERDRHKDTVSFVQDGATPYISEPVQRLLCSTFEEDHIISRSTHMASQIPYLTPWEFWLWEFMKSKVY